MSIKLKDNSLSYFSKEVLCKFEFKLFLCLDIIRFELQTNEQITDSTADAIRVLFVFNAIQYFREDFPEIFNKCAVVFSKLMIYNKKLFNHDLKSKIGFEDARWAKYFKKTISSLILSSYNG
jgi:hypothetical protein